MKPACRLICKVKSLGTQKSHECLSILHNSTHLVSIAFDLSPEIRILIENLDFKSPVSSIKFSIEQI